MLSVSRRVLLRGGALGAAVAVTAGCATGEAGKDAGSTAGKPVPPDPETALLRELIAGKERTVALYASASSERLVPFRRRHEAHLAELRRRLPPAAAAPSSGSSGPSGPRSGMPPPVAPSGTPSPTGDAARPPSLRSLRDLERRAAALRVRQVAGASPPLAQLIASIGACEAAHALALSRSL